MSKIPVLVTPMLSYRIGNATVIVTDADLAREFLDGADRNEFDAMCVKLIELHRTSKGATNWHDNGEPSQVLVVEDHPVFMATPEKAVIASAELVPPEDLPNTPAVNTIPGFQELLDEWSM